MSCTQKCIGINFEHQRLKRTQNKDDANCSRDHTLLVDMACICPSTCMMLGDASRKLRTSNLGRLAKPTKHVTCVATDAKQGAKHERCPRTLSLHNTRRMHDKMGDRTSWQEMRRKPSDRNQATNRKATMTHINSHNHVKQHPPGCEQG